MTTNGSISGACASAGLCAAAKSCGIKPLTTINNPTSGIVARKNGARRPKRVQVRSLRAPTSGWMMDCSNERVLLSQPMMMLLLVKWPR